MRVGGRGTGGQAAVRHERCVERRPCSRLPVLSLVLSCVFVTVCVYVCVSDSACEDSRSWNARLLTSALRSRRVKSAI